MPKFKPTSGVTYNKRLRITLSFVTLLTAPVVVSGTLAAPQASAQDNWISNTSRTVFDRLASFDELFEVSAEQRGTTCYVSEDVRPAYAIQTQSNGYLQQALLSFPGSKWYNEGHQFASLPQKVYNNVGAGQDCSLPSGYGQSNPSGRNTLELPEWSRDFLGDVAYFGVAVAITGSLLVGASYINPPLAASPAFEAAAGCVGGAVGNAVYLSILGQKGAYNRLSALLAGCVTTAGETLAFSQIGKFLHARVISAANALPASVFESAGSDLASLPRTGSSSSMDSIYSDAMSRLSDLA